MEGCSLVKGGVRRPAGWVGIVCTSSHVSRFEKDVQDMLGRPPSCIWKILLVAVSPLVLLSLFIFYIVSYIQGGTPTYQAWDKDLVRPSVSLTL